MALAGAFRMTSFRPRVRLPMAMLKVRVGLEDGGGIVRFAAGVQDGQRALTEQLEEPRLTGFRVGEDVDLPLGKQLQRAPWADGDVDLLRRTRRQKLKVAPT